MLGENIEIVGSGRIIDVMPIPTPTHIKYIEIGNVKYSLDANLWDGYSTSKIKNINGVPVIGDGDKDIVTIEPIISITYEDLVYTIDDGGLIPGQQYRIIDYETTTSQDNTFSAGHKFDIIVTAISENKLSEEARACYHEYLIDGSETPNANSMSSVVGWEGGGSTFFYSGKQTIDGKLYFKYIDETYPEYFILLDFTNVLFDENYVLCPNYYSLDNGRTLIEYGEISSIADDILIPVFFGVNDTSVMEDIIKRNYFKYYGSNLSAWKIWYCFKNDDMRFGWAQTDGTGKGVIYRMIDEYGNDCPYDFKNIMFDKSVLDQNYNETFFVYTFNNTISDPISCEFKKLSDLSIDGNKSDKFIYNNVIKPYYIDGIQCLNMNIFDLSVLDPESEQRCYNNIFDINCHSNLLSSNVFDNIFGEGCYLNILENNCTNNTFGNNCYHNTFGKHCNDNTFGNGCQENRLEYCTNNTFGNDCNGNTFGNDCNGNTFGNNCNGHTFGNNCFYNTFGNNCEYIILGSDCTNNTFGNRCYHNTFGNVCTNNTLGNGCQGNYFLESCVYNILYDNCIGNNFNNGFEKNILNEGCCNNTFEDGCSLNKFGINCSYNYFGINCYHNTFGNNCERNKFANNCIHNTFGNGCTDNKFIMFYVNDENQIHVPYVNSLQYGDGVSYICLYSNSSNISSTISDIYSSIKNFKVSNGLSGNENEMIYIAVPFGCGYENVITKDLFGEIHVRCFGDII